MRTNTTSLSVISLLLFVLVVPTAEAKATINFKLERTINIGGKTVSPGEYEVAWVTHSPETDVNFTRKGKVVAEAHGKMVERERKSGSDTLVTVKDNNGQEILKEIRFAGKKSVIVLE